MERIKYRISLDMFEVASQTTIKAKKGDTACSIHITLMENGKVYKIDEGCTAFFSAKKPDDKYLFNSETCRIEDNTIIYDFTKQTTPIEGIVECEVVLKKGEDKLTSPRFNLKVDATVYNGEDIISTPEADALKELTDRAEEIVNQYDEGIIVGKGYVDNNFANALKGSASGKVVAIRDVSPVQHDIKVKATPVVVADTNVSAGNSITFEPITEWVITTSAATDTLSFIYEDGSQKYQPFSASELFGDQIEKYNKIVFSADGTYTHYYYDDEAMTSLAYSLTDIWEVDCLVGIYSNEDIHIKVEAAIQDSVEVKLYGKNLCDFKAFKPYSGGTITLLENGLVYTGRYYISLDGSFMKPNNRYYFSWKYETSDNIVPIYRIQYADDTYSNSIQSGKGITITKEVKNLLLYPEITGTVHTTTLTDIQIETGMAVSEYEPYIEPTTHTVVADGSAFDSVYPSMTFVPEKDGVELSVEYNRDINKAFAQLQAALISMGGNI